MKSASPEQQADHKRDYRKHETTIKDIFLRTEWQLLCAQKNALTNIDEPWAEGLFNFIDAIQEVAQASGYPVVWLNDRLTK